jgi:two-component system, response regulator PdtaR
MKPERILLIEDEMIISASILELLNRLGYQNVEIAATYEEGLQRLLNSEYDIALVDIFLGDGPDGIDLIKAVSAHKEVSFIYLTGTFDKLTLYKAKSTMPLAFITKPISETNLKVHLELFMKKRERREVREA